MRQEIPAEVKEVVEKLEKAGHEGYVVGGCVRDLLLGREPTDWDVATSAPPEEIQKLFPNTFYENRFFTVTVLTGSADPALSEIEVTTFRADITYGDRRHPEKVEYAKTIEEDLARRDFTMNAIALRADGDVIDPFGGQQDLGQGLIRAVGEPERRFQEDALRMMRAVRFVARLGLEIEEKTKEAIKENSRLIREISQERIRDEFLKIISSSRAVDGVKQLRDLGLLSHVVPELEEGYGVTQNKHHVYTVWEHNLLSLEYAVQQEWSQDVRLAALFHDVAKPRVKEGEGPDATFYGHEVVGAKLTRSILNRLKFPRKQTEKIGKLVRYHMFFYDVDTVSESSVRRLLRKVGAEDMEDLLKLRMADRIGSGVPKAEPYRLRHFQYLLEKVSQDPISSKMLKMDGNELMKIAGIEPGPKVGQILSVLLAEVLDDPGKNERMLLEQRVKELSSLSDEELSLQAKAAREAAEHIEERRDEMTKKKYWVS